LPDLLKYNSFIGNDEGLVNLGKGKNVANTRTLSVIVPVGTNRRIGLYGAKERALSAKL
jgi:hypothetical protein